MTTDHDWDHEYRHWLNNLLGDLSVKPEESYSLLIDDLDKEKFKSFVPGDENRRDDGVFLRTRFSEESGLTLGFSRRRSPCTFFEMLVAFSERVYMSSTDEDLYETPHDVFLYFLRRMGIHDLTDSNYMDIPVIASNRIYDAVRKINYQEYESDGSNGGLFQRPHFIETDYRDVQLWDQMQSHMVEHLNLY